MLRGEVFVPHFFLHIALFFLYFFVHVDRLICNSFDGLPPNGWAVDDSKKPPVNRRSHREPRRTREACIYYSIRCKPTQGAAEQNIVATSDAGNTVVKRHCPYRTEITQFGVKTGTRAAMDAVPPTSQNPAVEDTHRGSPILYSAGNYFVEGVCPHVTLCNT